MFVTVTDIAGLSRVHLCLLCWEASPAAQAEKGTDPCGLYSDLDSESDSEIGFRLEENRQDIGALVHLSGRTVSLPTCGHDSFSTSWHRLRREDSCRRRIRRGAHGSQSREQPADQ